MMEKNGEITDATPNDAPYPTKGGFKGISPKTTNKTANDRRESTRTSHPATRAADAVADVANPKAR